MFIFKHNGFSFFMFMFSNFFIIERLKTHQNYTNEGKNPINSYNHVEISCCIIYISTCIIDISTCITLVLIYGIQD